jgi:Domain of unknown function (DUF4160)
MPEICRFYGIVILMFHGDHNPPHFHVRYGEYKASFEIKNLGILDGSLPKKAYVMVIEWALENRENLIRNWELCQANKNPNKLEPL